MTGGRHPKRPWDRKRDRGIGTSKGAFARVACGPEEIAGEHSLEGDGMNDATREVGVDPRQQARTNR